MTKILNEDGVPLSWHSGKSYFKSTTERCQPNHPMSQTQEPQQKHTLSWDRADLFSHHKSATRTRIDVPLSFLRQSLIRNSFNICKTICHPLILLLLLAVVQLALFFMGLQTSPSSFAFQCLLHLPLTMSLT